MATGAPGELQRQPLGERLHVRPVAPPLQRADHMHALAAGQHGKARKPHRVEHTAHIARRRPHIGEFQPLVRIEVEDEIVQLDIAARSTVLAGRLQRPELAAALRIERHQLAVEDRAFGFKTRQRRRDRRIAPGPVLAVAGDQPHLSARDQRLDAVAVILDLVHPVLALWRLLRQPGKLGLARRRKV